MLTRARVRTCEPVHVSAPPAPAVPSTRLLRSLAELLNPTRVLLDRPTRPDEADQLAHAEQMARLQARHAAYRARRDAAGMRRTLQTLIACEEAHRARDEARTAREAVVPSLLDQLRAAVESTAGGGSAARGPHRSPIGLAAAELLGHIARTVGRRTTLTEDVHAWALTHPDEAADQVQRWVTEALDIVEPPRTLEACGACPRCGERHVWRCDGDEWVRRAAIRITEHRDPARTYAECLNPACDGRWPRTHFDLLAAALRVDGVA